MKRFFSKLLKRKSKTKVYHINYSDKIQAEITGQGHTLVIGTIRDRSSNVVGQFFYLMVEFGAIVCNRTNNKKYFIPKDKKSDWNCVDAYIHPELGGLDNAHSLTNFLKEEFGI